MRPVHYRLLHFKPSAVRMVFAAIVAAATAPSANAQLQPITCTANAGVTPIARAEGRAEPVADVVLNCTGGISTPVGQQIQWYDIRIFLNVATTTRLLTNPFSEALLMIDDPQPANQFPCVPASGLSTCYNYQGRPFGGRDPGTETVAGANKNIFQGQIVAANSIFWSRIPVDPPGQLAQRTLRITNVRANANQLGVSSTLIPQEISMFVSTLLPIGNPIVTVAFSMTGLIDQSVRGPSGEPLTKTFIQCVEANRELFINNNAIYTGAAAVQTGQHGRTGLLRFREAFSSSFKRRTIASPVPFTADVSSPLIPQDDPGGIVSLLTPGVGTFPYSAAGAVGRFFAEMGFYNPSFPAQYANTGVADTGTRLMARFDNVPPGIALYAGLYEVDTSAVGAPMKDAPTSRVRLVSTDRTGGGSFSPIAGTSTAESAGQAATFASLAPVSISNGSGMAVWEVMRADPSTLETIVVPFSIAYTSSSSPQLGTATVRMGMAPLRTAALALPMAEIPGFADTSSSMTLFTMSPCFSVRPAPIAFTYKIGSAVPRPISVQVSSGMLPVTFQVSPSVNWLSLQSSGTTPAFLKVSIVPAGLPVGDYQGTITIIPAGGASGPPTAVPVNLRVRARA